MLFGKLGWDKEVDQQNICLKKEQLTNMSRTLTTIPHFLKELIVYTRTLEFDECPDYNEIINIFEKVFKELGYEEDDIYEYNDK